MYITERMKRFAGIDESIESELAIFNKQWSYHAILSTIKDDKKNRRRLTRIGNGRDDISKRDANAAARAGYITIVTVPRYGDTAELTNKGEEYLRNSEDAFQKI